MRIRLCTVNLKHDYWKMFHTHWSKRKEAVGAFFIQENPDIVGTQELCKERIEELSAMLPAYAHIGIGRDGGEKGEYTAIFYKKDKYTCEAQGTFWLSGRPERERSRGILAMFPRICTWGLFSDVHGRLLGVANTHLDHISPFARNNGLNQIGTFMKARFDGIPSVLMGDFNAKPKSKAIRRLERFNGESGMFTGSSYQVFYNTSNTHALEGRTYHGFHGKVKGKPIDYIFTSKQIQINQVHVVQQKFCGRYLSDHFPIVMECSIGKE